MCAIVPKLSVVPGATASLLSLSAALSKSLACRVGWHHWETEMRRLDDIESPPSTGVLTLRQDKR